MLRRYIYLLLVAVGITMFPPRGWTQKVIATVTVDLRRIPHERRYKVENLQDKLLSYINNFKWTEERYDYEIPIVIQIYLEDVSTNYEDRYKGRFLISNRSDMQFFDRRWMFNYSFTDNLQHSDTNFNPLTSFIDFYIYIMLGFEYDKCGRFAGTEFFEKARNISQQARFSRFIDGWDERKVLIDKVLSKENLTFRQAVDLYFLGLSYQQQDSTALRKYCREAIALLYKMLQYDPQHQMAQQFTKNHSAEIIDIFKNTRDKSVFQKMILIDPAHKDMYQKYLNNSD
ncbi:hypothetical protein DRQ15_07830 [candidate division KSB1 bacterium]|nr:MAG: hypothetical protein DRQ15_07830 [candidate division KSB1 bacterium]